MPSTEHAPMPQDGPPGPGTGSVIHLDARRRKGRTVEPVPEPQSTPAFQVALTVQAMYQTRGLSLRDPVTATAYETAIDAVLLLADGAHATDVLDTETWGNLRAMVKEMQQAPNLV